MSSSKLTHKNNNYQEYSYTFFCLFHHLLHDTQLCSWVCKLGILKRLIIKNSLQRGEECYTYLTHLKLSSLSLEAMSISTDMSQVGVTFFSPFWPIFLSFHLSRFFFGKINKFYNSNYREMYREIHFLSLYLSRFSFYFNI